MRGMISFMDLALLPYMGLALCSLWRKQILHVKIWWMTR